MDWVLFLQIEIILMTFGLVMAFILSCWQTAKDNSFVKRTKALGNTLKQTAESIGQEITKKQGEQHDE